MHIEAHMHQACEMTYQALTAGLTPGGGDAQGTKRRFCGCEVGAGVSAVRSKAGSLCAKAGRHSAAAMSDCCGGGPVPSGV